MHPVLEKSYKNCFPFRLGTTSFIYPDSYDVNVRRLGPNFDEIELLFLESSEKSLPSKDQIDLLAILARQFDLTYNVHLPTDIAMGHPDITIRNYAVETVKRVVGLAEVLCPTTYTLHLEYHEMASDEDQINMWLERLSDSMEQVVSSGIKGSDISVETLFYPFHWIEEIIAQFGLSVCIDLGHLFVRKFDPKIIFDKYYSRIPIVHLHGVENQTDHIGLERLAVKHENKLINILNTFTGTVSLEVFSYKHLASSLVYLEKLWNRIG